MATKLAIICIYDIDDILKRPRYTLYTMLFCLLQVPFVYDFHTCNGPPKTQDDVPTMCTVVCHGIKYGFKPI